MKAKGNQNVCGNGEYASETDFTPKGGDKDTGHGMRPPAAGPLEGTYGLASAKMIDRAEKGELKLDIPEYPMASSGTSPNATDKATGVPAKMSGGDNKPPKMQKVHELY